MERSVVVLPQPLGPSSVKRCPSATVKLTSCAALTIWPWSLGYSVNRPSIFSTSCSSYSLTPYFLPSHCAIRTSTKSVMMKSTPSAESSTYWPFSHSSQMTMETTWVSGL